MHHGLDLQGREIGHMAFENGKARLNTPGGNCRIFILHFIAHGIWTLTRRTGFFYDSALVWKERSGSRFV